MATFWVSWFPNIVCTAVGCAVSFIAGWYAGRRPSMLQETIALAMEKDGKVSLGRDARGRLTGGYNVTVAVTGLRATFGGGSKPTSSEQSPQAGEPT